MNLEEIFKEFFYQVYRGKNPYRDFNILLDFYFPPLNRSTMDYMTLQELADKYPELTTRERIRQILNDFENSIKSNNVIYNSDSQMVEFCTSIFSYLRKNDQFTSIMNLCKIYDCQRSLVGILRIAKTLNINTIPLHIVYINQNSFVVPEDVNLKQVSTALAKTRKLVNHLGCAYPYQRLKTIKEWNFFPESEQKIQFLKDLLQTEKGFIELGDGDFFGFIDFGHDRLFFRLVQIFNVYEKVPKDKLVNSLYRTLRKRLSSESPTNLEILKECSDVFDEYCIRANYCSEQGGYFFPSENLSKYITENFRADDKLYTIECKLVRLLQENGYPMTTNDFIKILKDLRITKSEESHIMEYSNLIYRTGFRRNSVYHTLDDQYNLSLQIENQQSCDRKRTEINLVNRDSYLTKKVKRLCQYECQICGAKLQISDDDYYSEIHHIRPLGTPHNGPDVIENMLCVCPNCHVLLDYGAIQIVASELFLKESHIIKSEFIDYHNQFIYNS